MLFHRNLILVAGFSFWPATAQTLPSYSTPSNTNQMPTDLAAELQLSENPRGEKPRFLWGPWEQASNYPGVAFRALCGHYNSSARANAVYIEFENNYQANVMISFTIGVIQPYTATIDFASKGLGWAWAYGGPCSERLPVEITSVTVR